MYEGYGPGGVAFIMDVATDNVNRTIAEVRSVFDKAGGALGKSGSVAFKFTKRGSVAVNVGFDPRAKTLDIAVRDTGAGIDPENLPKIFDMFHQAPNGVHRGGVGLGLYIVKRFVDLLGGHIEASSRLGEGSTFHFSLPAGVVAQPASLEEHRRRRSA